MTTPGPITGQMSFDELMAPTPPDATEAADPAVRADPMAPTDPTGPIGPVDSIGPTDSIDLSASAAPRSAPLDVEVIRSTRRRKTAQARLVGATLEIRIPDRCSAGEEREFVDHFRQKFERMRDAAAIDLEARANDLATRYGLPAPTSIRWVDNQNHRWGSCTPADGSIRLSSRMATFPAWVIDYVVVHELAHLLIADHSPAFWDLVAAYPLAERARGYLMAKAGDGLD